MNRRGFFQTFLAGLAAWLSGKFATPRNERWYRFAPYPNRAWTYNWKSRVWRGRVAENQHLFWTKNCKFTEW